MIFSYVAAMEVLADGGRRKEEGGGRVLERGGCVVCVLRGCLFDWEELVT
jgi:hypothetical protein